MAFTKKNIGVLYVSVSMVLMLSSLAASAEPTRKIPITWIKPGQTGTLATINDYKNEHGTFRTLFEQPIKMDNHPFFMELGENGRGCISCHQPSDSMSLSVNTIQAMWDATDGKDPIFAAYDGSNCPTMDPSKPTSHSLLLNKGLFRIEMPWPPRPRYGEPVKPDFSIDVVRDPWGCNSGDKYGPNAKQANISVYRRPRPVANMKYLLATGFEYDPKKGVALPRDPETGEYLSGNFMADNRVISLKTQMFDASATHLEMVSQLNAGQVAQILEFEKQIYTAQSNTDSGDSLSADGAFGGPEELRDSEPGVLGNIGRAVWSEFESWESMTRQQKSTLTPAQVEYRESVARGARVFRERMFLITDTAGINSPIGFGNPVLNSCVFCHNMSQMGNDVAPGQVDLGTTVKPFADPMPDLPLFKITCLVKPHPHYGREFYTTDPGYGLISGNCHDVGKITIQSMRGLAGRPPYFSNGMASDFADVVDFYDRRYNIGYTEQERQDLINLMRSL